jgi:uncharacterized protein with von Willebrand factor type A (vWA) domain
MSQEHEGRLAENIVYFARALRAAGIPLGPRSVIDALYALQAAGVGTRDDFYWTLHAVFVKRHEHSMLFDQAFRIFFRKRAYLERLMSMLMPQVETPSEERAPPPASQRVLDALFAGIGEKLEQRKSEIEVDMRLTMSDREILEKKDFAQMSAAEIADARQAIKRLALPLDEVRTRRLAPARHGRMIDIRRTLRASMKAGGAVIDLHGVTDARKRVSTFLFGTRLTNVTRALRERDPDDALAACSSSVLDWSGGTRIGTSLAAFNKHWARRVLSQGAIVLLITDGLERDPDDRLAFEVDRLHRSCRRLIWLNPLLRYEGFEARAGGIRAMLPHVDELRPIHNLESMAELCRALSAHSGQGNMLGGDRKALLKQVA